MAAVADLAGEHGSGLRRKKGGIVPLYTAPPVGSTVICLDELGPLAARRSPGPSGSDDAHRPHLRPADARHGSRWAFGARAQRTGAVLVQTAATRDTAAWLRFLDSVEAFAPPGDAYLIVDALPLRRCSGASTRCGGTGAIRASTSCHCPKRPPWMPWLNLIEGFWKILGQRALAGRHCTRTEAVDHAVHAGVADWNRHPTPFLWGRPPKPRRQLKRRHVYRI